MPSDEYEHLEQALPGFSKARLTVKTGCDSTRPLGFKGNKFEFYRFANRFRLATSFRGMNLEGFTPETTDGYSALYPSVVSGVNPSRFMPRNEVANRKRLAKR